MRLARLRILATLDLVLLAAPVAVDAQQAGRMYRIGFLSPGPITDWSETRETFRQGLQALGYIEGQNTNIEWRFTASGYDRLPDLAAELVQLNPDVIVTVTTPAAKAAKAATTTIPIVMSGVARPVEQGLVASMARPGGKRDWHHRFPRPGDPPKAAPVVKGDGAQDRPGCGPDDVERARADLLPRVARYGTGPGRDGRVRHGGQPPARPRRAAQARADALYVFSNTPNWAHRRAILDFAATNRLPTVHNERDWVTAGGLVSYNPDWQAMRRRAAAFVVKILNGIKPADIPVEDPTTFRLAINLKTAKALGLTIPPSVLARADDVIQ
jgi:putative tryptophan/tyrosine transport system substrate-binding protein